MGVSALFPAHGTPDLPGAALLAGLAVRVGRDLEARMQRELLHHVADVALYSMRRDVEPLRDLLVAETFTDQLDHFALAPRHADVVECATGRRPVSRLR